ncbi:hypothetical protein AB0B45_02455 [Nonomuraea sp. NPDC049152]|uniref:hypothetical protein n=1 Tax=Nonomuraea sp. NPDC049152 TaxID=3154350 RepID=UPI0033DB5F0E
MTVTLTVNSDDCALKVFVVTGADTANPLAGLFGTSSTLQNVTDASISAQPGEWVIGAGNDYSGAGTCSTSDVGEAFDNGGQSDGIAVRKSGAVLSAGPVTVNFATTATNPRWAIMLARIAPAPTPPSGPLTNSFNGGSANAAITVGNSGGASGNAFTNVVGLAYYTTSFTHGPGLAVINPGVDSDTHLDWQSVAMAGDVFCSRLYVYRTGSFTGFRGLFALNGPTGIVSKAWINSDNKIYVYTSSATTNVATTGTAIPADQWVRIEFRYTINSAGNGTVEVWTYLSADSTTHTNHVTSATVAWPGGKPSTAEFHVTSESSGRVYLDDVAIGPTKLGPVGGGPITGTVGQVGGGHQALPVVRRKRRLLAQPVSQETATSIKSVHRRTVGAVGEVGAAQLIRPVKVRTVGAAAQIDAATVARPVRARLVGQAREGDDAGAVIVRGGRGVDPAVETESALPIRAVKIYQVGQASDVSAALTARPARVRLVGTAADRDQAAAVWKVHRRTLGTAGERGLADRMFPGTLGLVRSGERALPITPLLHKTQPLKAGAARTAWRAASPASRWTAGQPAPTWAASTARVIWSAGRRRIRWSASSPHT